MQHGLPDSRRFGDYDLAITQRCYFLTQKNLQNGRSVLFCSDCGRGSWLTAMSACSHLILQQVETAK